MVAKQAILLPLVTILALVLLFAFEAILTVLVISSSPKGGVCKTWFGLDCHLNDYVGLNSSTQLDNHIKISLHFLVAFLTWLYVSIYQKWLLTPYGYTIRPEDHMITIAKWSCRDAISQPVPHLTTDTKSIWSAQIFSILSCFSHNYAAGMCTVKENFCTPPRSGPHG